MTSRAGIAEMNIMTFIRILTTLTLCKMVAFWVSVAKAEARGLEPQDAEKVPLHQLEE